MSERFYESPVWRFVVTDLESRVLTILDKLATNRTVTLTLNAPSLVTGSAPSDNGEVAGIYSVDGDPFLNEGNRLLYCLRREADGTDRPYVCQAAGMLLYVKDTGGPNSATTDFKAYDPWQYLYRRPVVDINGDLPCTGALAATACEGYTYPAGTRGDEMVLDLLVNTTLNMGETHIDYGSIYWTGTIEATDTLDDMLFQQGLSVGEAFDALVGTGTLDIVLDPVYDPFNRPGITHQLSVYVRAGVPRYNAVFAWDKPGRSAVELSAEYDGNERANVVQFYAGQGGPPVPQQTDGLAVSDFGEYWAQQFFPGQTSAAAVEALAAAQLRLRSRGLRTFGLSPTPESAPIPFQHYGLGDTVPVYASARLRQPIAEMLRVHSMPLVIGDDQLEAASGLLVALDEEAGT